jgi:hypothetical protein
MNRFGSVHGAGADVAGARRETFWPWRDIPDPGPVPPAPGCAPDRCASDDADACRMEDDRPGGLQRRLIAVGLALLVGVLLVLTAIVVRSAEAWEMPR